MSPRPAKVTRDQILEAALAIVDAEGPEALTMRALGKQLGVDPMVPYRLFPSRESVAHALVDQFWESFRPPVAHESSTWQEQARILMRALRSSLAEHPRLIPLVATRPITAPGALGVADTAIGSLLQRGAPLVAGLGHLINTLVMLTVASALGEYSSPVGSEGAAAHVDDAQPPQQSPDATAPLPHLAALAQAGFEPAFDVQFEAALTAILTGWRLE